MLELRSYKHTHVREECSLLLSFGSGISYLQRKVIKGTSQNVLSLFILHTKNYSFKCDLCNSRISSNSVLFANYSWIVFSSLCK